MNLQNATKKWEDKIILSHCNFSFSPKTTYILTGKNGVGKTTLLNILAGYTPLDSGNIQYNPNGTLQYMTQMTLLFPSMTVLENLYIKYCSDSSHSQSYEQFSETVVPILQQCSLQSLQMQKVCFLSGGEQKRLQLAQLLLFQPNIILLDEPFCWLDQTAKMQLRSLISNIFTDTLTIIVSHEEEPFSNCCTIELKEGGLKIK